MSMDPHFELPTDFPPEGPWQPSLILPDDPSLPGLGTIRASGLAEALPELDLGDVPVELRLCNYVAGSRATFEARAGDRRFAIKLYADDPSLEAQLYRKFRRVGFARDFGARAPRLLAFDHDLRLLIFSWLEGKPANQLVKEGQGDRAGQLAASCLWHLSRLRVKLGPPCGPGRMLYHAGMSTAALTAADPVLGSGAKAVARTLVLRQPAEGRRQLVHGTLYARHILDMGNGPGVIDWQQFGQGPVEVDAGIFLASITRIRLRHDSAAAQGKIAEETFLSRTQGLVDERTLDWYWAAGLLHLAARGLKSGMKQAVPREAPAMIKEAARRAERAVGSGDPGYAEPPNHRARLRSAFSIRRRARDPSLTGVASPLAEGTLPNNPHSEGTSSDDSH